MSVTEAVRVYKGKTEERYGKSIKRLLLQHTGCVVLGVLFSIAGFGKEFSPFGVAFAASVPKNFTLTAAAGSVLGYFVTLDSVTALRYTAAILALCVILSALKPFKQIRDNTFTPVAAVFVCVFVTGLAIAFSEKITATSFLLCFAESAVGGAASFVFAKSRSVLSLRGGLSMLTSKDATAIVISITLLLLSLSSFNILGVYPVHIIAQLLVLICAFYGREAGGAIVGICSGITMSLGNSNIFLLAFYSLGGLLAGAFSALGRFISYIAFAFSGIAVTAIAYTSVDVKSTVIETAISGVLFIFLSRKFNKKFEDIFVPSVTSPVIDTVKNGIVSKLKRASHISTEICSSLTSVNDVLAKTDKTDIKMIPKKTKEQVCGSCGLYDVCWGESFTQTNETFQTLLDLKKNGVHLEYKTVPQKFASFCIRSENVASNFNRLYTEYKIRESNQSRIQEIYNLAAEQFVNVSSLLDSLCEDINEDVRFDMDIAARVRAAASSCGFEPLEACCVMNTLEKMTVDIKIKIPYDKTQLKSFGTQLKIITDRELELPEIENYNSYARLVYKEKAEYKIVSAGVQFNANGEKYSGDSFTTFEDNNGYFYAVICDGMGTGTKAAISSNLAVTLLEKLIKAGFGIKASINTVNTSLISKSGEECSVTLDLVVFDLFTGRTEFYKCGAADTVVKRNSKIVDVGFSSLPLGIINGSETGCGSGMLGTGDVIVMHSDGVREEDTDFLKRRLKTFDNGNVRNFTTDICETIRRGQPEKNDDMTVLTLAITKNN